MSNLDVRVLTGVLPQIRAVQAIFDDAHDYAHLSTGQAPRPHEASKMFSEFPPGIGQEDKFCFGGYVDEVMVGCADVLRGFPDSQTAFIGLLLVAQAHQGKGYGRALYQQLERICSSWQDVSTIRLAVLTNNEPAFSFWEAMGFTKTSEVKPYRDGKFETSVELMDKKVRQV